MIREIEDPLWVARFMAKILPEPNSGCWLWDGCLVRGYGCVGGFGRTVRAHRVSYELHCGPIPKGMSVLHRCDLPACANPAHLFLGSQADNIRDMVKKRRHPSRRGEANGFSKLTEADIAAIRASPLGSRRIAPSFGVGSGQIRNIRARKTWRHVP